MGIGIVCFVLGIAIFGVSWVGDYLVRRNDPNRNVPDWAVSGGCLGPSVAVAGICAVLFEMVVGR